MPEQLTAQSLQRITAPPNRQQSIPGPILTGVEETALIALWARAEETVQPQPLFIDAKAVELITALDYDFSRFKESWKTLNNIAIRTWILDKEVSAYLDIHPESVVINLGAGFDNRFWRMDNGSILWYDIDLPSVIYIKKSFIEEKDRYRMIGKSILDNSWLDDVETTGRPVIVIAEGLLMYLDEPEITQLLDKLVNSYPGGDMLLELLAPGAVGTLYHDSNNTMNTGFKWSLLKGRDLTALHDKLRFIEEWCVLDYFRERWGWIARYADIPMFRNYFGEKIVHIKFS